LSQRLWFVVVSAQEAGMAEIGGPLVGKETITFEESELTLHWKEVGEDEDDELVVLDRDGDEIESSDPTAWDVHQHFHWRQTIVADSGGERWIIIVADDLVQAQAVQADHEHMSELWLDGPPQYNGEDDEGPEGGLFDDGEDGDDD